MVRAVSRIVAGGMLREGTPIQDYTKEFGLYVKREDLACPPPGPPFSKSRGVYARVASRPEHVIGVLDTVHSQAGHAVSRACQVLGKECINYYPEFKSAPGPKPPQLRAQALGARLVPLKAGRSCILYHQARRLTEEQGGYMMPNALKLEESVTETAREALASGLTYDVIVIPASSATIAAGVVKGFGPRPHYLIHLGYTRPEQEVKKYILKMSGVVPDRLDVIDEGYAYKDVAKEGASPPWPCNPYYDLKAFRWWLGNRDNYGGRVLFWNIG